MKSKDVVYWFLSIAAVLSILCASALYNIQSRILWSSEAYLYLTHYLGPTSISEKIFDFRGNDHLPGNYYRPRDLGNVFNYLDSELVLTGLRLGIPGLLSIVHYISLFLIALIHMYYSRKFLRGSGYLLPIFMILIFLTSPPAFLTGVYIRATKSVLALFIVMMFWIFFGRVRNEQKPTVLSNMVLYLLGVALALVDEIGSAFLLGYTVFALAYAFVTKKQNMLHAGAMLVIAIFSTILYRYHLGPFLVYSVTGIWPTVWDVRIIPSDIYSVLQLAEAPGSFLDYLRMLFGNTGRDIGMIVYATLFLLIAECGKNNKRKALVPRYFWPSIYVFGTLLGILAIVLMTITHPPIVDLPWKMRYYPIPFHAFMISAVTVILSVAYQYIPKISFAGLVICILILVLNIIALPEYFKVSNDQAQDMRWTDTRELTDPILHNTPITIVNPDTHQPRLEAIDSIRSRLRVTKSSSR